MLAGLKHRRDDRFYAVVSMVETDTVDIVNVTEYTNYENQIIGSDLDYNTMHGRGDKLFINRIKGLQEQGWFIVVLYA